MGSDSLQLATATIRDLAAPRFIGALPEAGAESGEWIRSLRAAGVRQSGPALVLALDGLRRADCSPSRRFSVLRLLKRPVLKTCAGLPKPWTMPLTPGSAASAADPVQRGVTVEQRLYWLMFQNLNQALRQFDRCYLVQDEQQGRRRDWATHNLFRFFGRQIRYAALWGRPLPENAWRDLHDLYVYLLVRRMTQGTRHGHPGSGQDDTDIDNEYKQLLLFGLAAQRSAAGVRSESVMAGLEEWARETVLEDPQGMYGDVGLYVVEVAEDRPPRQLSGPLGADFRGWVLVPPAAFIVQLERSARDDDARGVIHPARAVDIRQESGW